MIAKTHSREELVVLTLRLVGLPCLVSPASSASAATP
jgi:hypothetical protein